MRRLFGIIVLAAIVAVAPVSAQADPITAAVFSVAASTWWVPLATAGFELAVGVGVTPLAKARAYWR